MDPAAHPIGDEIYVTVLLRNHLVAPVDETSDGAGMVRSFVTGGDWRAIEDDLLARLSDVERLSLRFAGEGFDPVMFPSDDKEALDLSEAYGVVVSVPPGGEEAVRRVVSGLVEHRDLHAAWVLVADPGDTRSAFFGRHPGSETQDCASTDPSRSPAVAPSTGSTGPVVDVESSLLVEQELRRLHCWFASDVIPRNPAATGFRRRARWHQAVWREAKGLPVGSEPYRGGPRARPVGSRMALAAARSTGANFVTSGALEAVNERLGYVEAHQMLAEDRLWCDLLSSMPLCFNLFGPVAADREAADRAVHAWWPDTPGRVAEVRFEWSPGRRDPLYLGNRSAFDVAFILDLPGGQRGVLGVETKYHEHPVMEMAPSEERLGRYLEVTERSGAFAVAAQEHLVATELQQLWLDHLLALSTLQHPGGDWGWARFVVVHPARNVGFSAAVEAYRSQLADATTFANSTIEELVETPGALSASDRTALQERYIF